MQKNLYTKITIIIFSIFLLISLYFWNYLSNLNYIGITLTKVNENFYVEKILNNGINSTKNIMINDKVIKIDNKDIKENKIANKWYIIEQADSIVIERNSKIYEIKFDENHILYKTFPIYFITAIYIFCILFILSQKKIYTRTTKLFYYFLILYIFTLISANASSLGNNIARFIIVTTISFSPYFFKEFTFNIYNIHNKYLNFIFKILFFINIINYIICILHIMFNFNFLIYKLIISYCFFILSVSFMVIPILNFLLNKNKTQKFYMITTYYLSFTPLIFGYIYPLKYKIPFYLTIPFLNISIYNISHLLIHNKFINYKFNKKILYFVITTIITSFCLLFIILCKYVPIYIIFIYFFIFIYQLLPMLEKDIMLSLSNDKTKNYLSIFSAVEFERENISTFIHDTTIQDIIHVLKKIEINSNEKMSKNEIIIILEDIIYDLRELCSNIYPLMIQEFGLKNAILEIINQFEKKHKILIVSNIEDINFDKEKNNFVFRTIKELINNSILHGNATQINIDIYQDIENYYFKVSDNGIFKEKKDLKNHFGLELIKQKLILLNGNINIKKENLTEIIIMLPKD